MPFHFQCKWTRSNIAICLTHYSIRLPRYETLLCKIGLVMQNSKAYIRLLRIKLKILSYQCMLMWCPWTKPPIYSMDHLETCSVLLCILQCTASTKPVFHSERSRCKNVSLYGPFSFSWELLNQRCQVVFVLALNHWTVLQTAGLNLGLLQAICGRVWNVLSVFLDPLLLSRGLKLIPSTHTFGFTVHRHKYMISCHKKRPSHMTHAHMHIAVTWRHVWWDQHKRAHISIGMRVMELKESGFGFI